METASDGGPHDDDRDITIRKGIPVTPATSTPTARSLRDLHASDDAATGQWRFSQCFGDKSEDAEISDGDIISTVEFDATGDFLASGDRAGRVVLFRRNHTKKKGCEYKFYTEFQSHEAEFDYLKSLEINERINSVAWAGRTGDAMCLLSTNDKTIKLWKVKERRAETVVENNRHRTAKQKLMLPRTIKQSEPTAAATPKHLFPHAHAYHIHSLSACSDGATFLSADDLRINLWPLDTATTSDSSVFNLVDLKPSTIEELTEVITSAVFHPNHCHRFAYSTSKGAVRLGDMRASALCDRASVSFGPAAGSNQNNATGTFFTEIVQSVSDVKFFNDHLVAARDYLSVRVWDARRPDHAVSTVAVHDPPVRQRLCDLYENDCIFDRFRVAWTCDGRQLISGTYGDTVKAIDIDAAGGAAGWTEDISADRSILALSASAAGLKRSTSRRLVGRRHHNAAVASANMSAVDFNRKALCVAVHPQELTMAVAATSNLFIFST